MAQKYVHFDLYLNGVGAPNVSRADLVKRVEALYRLDRDDSAAFVASGKRIRVRRGIDQDAAMKSIVELQGIGAIVEIEPNRPPDEALAALDAIDLHDQPPAIDGAATEVQELRRALKFIGNHPASGEITLETRSTHSEPSREHTSDSTTTAPRMPISLDIPTDPMALQSLDGEAAPLGGEAPTLDTVAPAVPIPAAAHAATSAEVTIGRESTAETNPAHDARFAAPSYEENPMVLDVIAPTTPAAPLTADKLYAEEPQLCPEHELPEPCNACADRDKPIPGRLMQGALRQKPGVRLAVGIGLGLLLGYLASMPYAGRAERRVADVRAEANLDRYKNAPEAQANTASLDQKAEDMSSNAMIGTIAIWLVVGGGIVAGWYRIT